MASLPGVPRRGLGHQAYQAVVRDVRVLRSELVVALRVVTPENVMSSGQQPSGSGVPLERIRGLGGGQTAEVVQKQKVKLACVHRVTTGTARRVTRSARVSVLHGIPAGVTSRHAVSGRGRPPCAVDLRVQNLG